MFYLFIDYNTITNYINLDLMLSVVQKIRVSSGNRTHNPHTKNLTHYILDWAARM